MRRPFVVRIAHVEVAPEIEVTEVHLRGGDVFVFPGRIDPDEAARRATAHSPHPILRERASRSNNLVRLQDAATLLCPHTPNGLADRDTDCRRHCGGPAPGCWERKGGR